MNDKKKSLAYYLGYFGTVVMYYSFVAVVLALAIKLILMMFGF